MKYILYKSPEYKFIIYTNSQNLYESEIKGGHAHF